MTDIGPKDKLLHSELTYILRGILFKVSNLYGLGMKEKVYHQALIDEFKDAGLNYQHEVQIPVLSWRDGRKIGTYIPDFVIREKIILEVKSETFITKQFLNQVYSYLRVTQFEIALIVNFGSEQLDIRRFIFTNNHKPQFRKHQ